jgi:hypothetical protein
MRARFRGALTEALATDIEVVSLAARRVQINALRPQRRGGAEGRGQ